MVRLLYDVIPSGMPTGTCVRLLVPACAWWYLRVPTGAYVCLRMPMSDAVVPRLTTGT
jgi:hypothetical protein